MHKQQIQGRFAQKYMNCAECPHFRKSMDDPIYMLGEQFNNMMFILEEKNNELKEAYEELKQTQSKLLQQEKMASIGQLAAGVAHELNNPMAFIASNLSSLEKYINRIVIFCESQAEIVKSLHQAAADEKLAVLQNDLKIDFILPDIRNLIAESLDGADRVRRIVQDLKNFSRIGQAELQLVNINECLDTTLNIVWNELKYKATLHKTYGDLPAIECNPQQLNQVFMNILVNATQAIERQGEIHINTWAERDEVAVAISDTGVGIRPEHLEHLFEPFFTTKQVGEGTGLGLSIVYDIVTKNHCGRISATSEVGKGSTFTVVLPQKQDQSENLPVETA